MNANKKATLPGKTIERLSQYRRLLFSSMASGKTNVYSHELARMMNLTPVQVRRDLMLIGYGGSQSKGYVIKDLIELIGRIIDDEHGLNLAIVGMGNLGRAFTSYLSGKRDKLSIVAAFDNDLQKTDRVIGGIPCYHISRIDEVIKSEHISLAILTVAPQAASDVARLLVEAGIKGILNYTSIPLNVPDHVSLEESDIITSLEKLAYFVK